MLTNPGACDPRNGFNFPIVFSSQCDIFFPMHKRYADQKHHEIIAHYIERLPCTQGGMFSNWLRCQNTSSPSKGEPLWTDNLQQAVQWDWIQWCIICFRYSSHFGKGRTQHQLHWLKLAMGGMGFNAQGNRSQEQPLPPPLLVAC